MWEDFYAIQKIYEDYSSTMQGNYPSINNTSAPGSYDPPMANGPGNGPVHPQGGAPSSGDLVHWDKTQSPQAVLDKVEQMLKHAIDEASEKKMGYAVRVLRPIYSAIVDSQTNQ